MLVRATNQKHILHFSFEFPDDVTSLRCGSETKRVVRDPQLFENKCSSHDRLLGRVEQRAEDFAAGRVSKWRLGSMCFRYSERRKHGNLNVECPIGMEGFRRGDAVCRLPCGHLFLKEEIEKWFGVGGEGGEENQAGSEEKRNRCAVCRHDCS